MDLHSVPRNHLRYISWIAYVIAKDPRHGVRESLAVSNAPHSNYYVQDGIDMGAMMDTTLPVAKVCILYEFFFLFFLIYSISNLYMDMCVCVY